MNTKKRPSFDQNAPLSDLLRLVLGRSASELKDLARLSQEIQWAISSLLDRAHHPDLSAEIHVLQDIDRLQQTLLDLARLIDGIDTADLNAPLAASALSNTLTLQSLKCRVFGDTDDISDTEKSKDITWF